MIFQLRSIFLFALASLFIVIATISTSLKAEQRADAHAPEQGHTPSPNQPSTQAKRAVGNKVIITTANPYASDAGYKILQSGGNAIDAMVTVQLVLGLVEPQSSGLGGGAFLLYYDMLKEQLHSIDGRETAPMEADGTLFLDQDGKPIKFFDAVVGGRSVGTPGTPKLLWKMHDKHGSLSWPEVLEPAIKLAQEGFIVSPRLAQALERDQDRLGQDETAGAYFYPKGKALTAGTLLKNPEYAETLKLLSQHGGDFFYQEAFARAIVEKVRKHPNPGQLSMGDFKNYEIVHRPPSCAPFLEFEVCGMGPPSSGAISVGQILGILEASTFLEKEPESAEAWHMVSEASRLAFADRGRYIADTDYVAMPSGMLEPDYLKQRANLISNKKSQTVAPGLPSGAETQGYRTGQSLEQPSTTHFVIVDQQQNVVSMTSTIENGFGSRLMIKGFLLNNELTDFSFLPEKDNQVVANRVEGGKRPRSSMAPTIVFENQKVVMALGSPGGSRIINYVANTLIRSLAWQQSLVEAIEQPHIVNRFGQLEAEQQASSTVDKLASWGYKGQIKDLNSGLHGIERNSEGWLGAADFRREGSVRSDVKAP